jgi:hypothetical protein
MEKAMMEFQSDNGKFSSSISLEPFEPGTEVLTWIENGVPFTFGVDELKLWARTNENNPLTRQPLDEKILNVLFPERLQRRVLMGFNDAKRSLLMQFPVSQKKNLGEELDLLSDYGWADLLRFKGKVYTQDTMLKEIENDIFLIGELYTDDYIIEEYHKVHRVVVSLEDLQNMQENVDLWLISVVEDVLVSFQSSIGYINGDEIYVFWLNCDCLNKWIDVYIMIGYRSSLQTNLGDIDFRRPNDQQINQFTFSELPKMWIKDEN